MCPRALLGVRGGFRVDWAGVAQLVEHLICNQRVGGSNPFASSTQGKLKKDPEAADELNRRSSLAPGLSSAVIPLRCMQLANRRFSGRELMCCKDAIEVAC